MRDQRKAVGWAVLLLLAGAAVAEGQYVGDSVRVREIRGGPWLAGRLIAESADSIALRSREQERRFALAGLDRVEQWRRSDPIPVILGSTLFSGALWYGMGEAVWWKDREPITGSKAGDVAIGAGIGALIGIVYHLATPGGWRRIWDGR